MKATSGLFITDKVLVDGYKKKIAELQASGAVGKDYEGTVEGKKVKLFLPDEVRSQYRAVLDAEAFIHSTFYTKTDDIFDLRMKLWTLARTHMLVDGKSGNEMTDDDFTVEFIEQVLMLYLEELILPLYHRSCTKVEETLRNRLNKYIEQSASA
jgi:hypothetical protein